MTIDEIKQALVEVQELCVYRSRCEKCPFAKVNDRGKLYPCRLDGMPGMWEIEDWSEDELNADD